MIPNELIREILVSGGFKLHDVDGQQDLKPYVYESVRKAIVAALDVKQIKWHDYENESTSRKAIISIDEDGKWGAVIETKPNTFGIALFDTREQAKAAAQEYHASQVYSNLVHGGPDND